MNFLSLFFTLFILNKYYTGECAVMQIPGKIQEYEDRIKREESLLATGVSDKARNRNSYDQSKPKFLDVISEDHGQPLDNLVESQDGSLEQTVKEKRCKTGENFVGLSRNPSVNLPLIRRDTASTFFKKSCDNCMGGPMCKSKGKCESCKKLCEKYEASLDQQTQNSQIDEPAVVQDFDNEEKVGISSRHSSSNEDQGGLSYGDDRYYTVGSFGPGPFQRLLAKMLNIKIDSLEELVILAKSKTKKFVKSIHPVVIDTAHVFTLNKGGPSRLDVELHKVSDAATNAEAIACKLDKEIDKAMQEKKEKSGSSYLAPKDIDEIILKTMGKNIKEGDSHDENDKLEQNMMRENDSENKTSTHLQEVLEKETASQDNINDTKTNIDSRLQLSDSQEQISNKKSSNRNDKHEEDSQNHSSLTELKNITAHMDLSNEPNTRKNSDDSSPNVGQQSPLHPRSDIVTTTVEPTTVHKGPRPPLSKNKKEDNEKNNDKEKEATPSQESLHERTTTPAADRIETTRHFGFPHGPKQDNANRNKSENLRQSSPVIPIEINNQEQDPKLGLTEEKIVDPTQETKLYEDKYNKLKQWVMETVGAEPPDSRENSQNHLGEHIKGIIHSASKINEEISNIAQHNTKDPNLLQMVRENNEKLRNLDDNKKLYSIKLPNMNEFRTRLSPDDERKINKVFENPRPLSKQRTNSDPYDTHPRKISQYKNGEWAYEKTKPNKPPYTTKHRASHPLQYEEYKDVKPVMEEVPFVDSQLMDMDKMVKSLKEMPKAPSKKENKVISITEPENMKNPLNAGRYQAEKRLEQEADNTESSQFSHKDSIPNEEMQTEEKNFNVQNTMSGTQDTTEKFPINGEENNETVACSKEEEEEMKQILHFLPAGRSSEHQSDRNTPLLDNLSSKSKPSDHKNEYTLENEFQSPKNTEDTIKSLNKMHKHGNTHSEKGRNFQNVNDESQTSFIQPINGPPMEVEQYNYPQEQNQRYSLPSYSDAMRMNSELSPNEMDPNFIEQQMLFNDQNLIGSPLMENSFKHTYQDPHLGKFLPRHSKHALSLHSRDVSEQTKPKDMFFVGDGIKLPLNMKEQHDGALHLSLDVKSLCNCKHCTARQLENNTIILEAIPFDVSHKQKEESATDDPTERGQAANVNTSSNETDSKEFDISSEEDTDFENQKVAPIEHETEKINISKRSLGAKNLLQDNEIHADHSTSDEKIIPMKTLSREEILSRLGKLEVRDKKPEDSSEVSKVNTTEHQKELESERHADQKMRLFSNVLDFMRKFALDV